MKLSREQEWRLFEEQYPTRLRFVTQREAFYEGFDAAESAADELLAALLDLTDALFALDLVELHRDLRVPYERARSLLADVPANRGGTRMDTWGDVG